MVKNINKDWRYYTLLAAGIYNILWGAWAIFFPALSFEILGAKPPHYLELWQCIGMIVGVYGLGYLIAATHPERHWPIIFVGLLGKILGPIGFIQALSLNKFPLSFGLNIIFNDLIWWIPFTLILIQVYKKLKYVSLEKKKILDEGDFDLMDKRKRVKLINSLSGFKSLNLVGTVDENKQTNLCVISSAFHLGANPSLIGFIIRPDSVPRDTLENMRRNKVCTLNHVHKGIVEQAHQTSARYPKDISEFISCELSEEYLQDFAAPFVKESEVKVALELEREITIEENGTHLMICKIIFISFPENIMADDGQLEIEKAGTLCVSGLDSYHESILLGRLSYAKKENWPDWL